MKTCSIVFCALAVSTLTLRSNGQTLYGATSSGHGELYILNPANGATIQDVGALNDSSSVNYSVTGLAFDPFTGVLYGSTGGVSGTELLTINPLTGLVTVVGNFNASGTMADIAFDAAGNLYGISASGGANLWSINTSTGAATEVGSSGFTSTAGGGLAISAAGAFYAYPKGNDFGTYDPTTGAYTLIGTSATPAGTGTSYAALDFDGNTLYGVDLGATPELVTIDTATGNITDLGSTSFGHLDAIAFSVPTPEPTTTALLLGSGATMLAVMIRRRQKA